MASKIDSSIQNLLMGRFENIPEQNSSLIRTTCEIPGKLLNSGNFNIRLVFFDKSEVKIITDFKDVSRLEIIDNKPRDIMWHGKFKGFFHPELKWKSELLCDFYLLDTYY